MWDIYEDIYGDTLRVDVVKFRDGIASDSAIKKARDAIASKIVATFSRLMI